MWLDSIEKSCGLGSLYPSPQLFYWIEPLKSLLRDRVEGSMENQKFLSTVLYENASIGKISNHALPPLYYINGRKDPAQSKGGEKIIHLKAARNGLLSVP